MNISFLRPVAVALELVIHQDMIIFPFFGWFTDCQLTGSTVYTGPNVHLTPGKQLLAPGQSLSIADTIIPQSERRYRRTRCQPSLSVATLTSFLEDASSIR